MWENCFDNCLGNEFLGITHKTQTTKLSKDEWDCFKAKLLHHKRKKKINKVKRQFMGWEEIIATMYLIRG